MLDPDYVTAATVDGHDGGGVYYGGLGDHQQHHGEHLQEQQHLHHQQQQHQQLVVSFDAGQDPFGYAEHNLWSLEPGGGEAGGGEEQQPLQLQQQQAATLTESLICQEGEVTTSSEVTQTSSGGSKTRPSSTSASSKSTKSKKKSAYKHVPHCKKPAHLVAKRNARERRRVHAVNLAFVKLRKALPFDNRRGKRISKVRILRRALEHIRRMREMVAEHDGVPYVEEDADVAARDDAHLFAF